MATKTVTNTSATHSGLRPSCVGGSEPALRASTELPTMESLLLLAQDVGVEMETGVGTVPDIPIPVFSDAVENDGVFSCTLSHCDVAFVNALRRTILTDIPMCCIRTETDALNQCVISVNDGRLHNEILKQRLSCIPVHTTDLSWLPGVVELVVDVVNRGETTLLVTSEHFQLRTIATGEFLPEETVRTVFPPDPLTSEFVEFCRLRPSNGLGAMGTGTSTGTGTGGSGSMAGDRLSLVAQFSVATAADSSMFNSTSKCTFFPMQDMDRVRDVVMEKQKVWKAEGKTEQEVAFLTRNFMLLDAQRLVLPNTFCLQIQSIGVYENDALLRMALTLLATQVRDFILTLSRLPKQKEVVKGTTETISTDFGYSVGKLLERYLPMSNFSHTHPHAVRFTFRSHDTPIHELMWSSLLLLQHLREVHLF